MPQPILAYRVFIASPGGLQEERKAFRDVIQSYNETDAVPRGVMFFPVGWELTLAGVGRPQSIINEEVRTCDNPWEDVSRARRAASRQKSIEGSCAGFAPSKAPGSLGSSG